MSNFSGRSWGGYSVRRRRVAAGFTHLRAFNAIGAFRMGADLQGSVHLGFQISGQDEQATATVSMLIRKIGIELVSVGWRLDNQLQLDTPLVGKHTPGEQCKIVATLK